MPYEWFKMYSKGWLTGSIRVQLILEERAIFSDLLAMANESRVRGVICRAEGIPYTREYIASFLEVPLDLLNSTIDKCSLDRNASNCNNPEDTRIIVAPDGCLIMSNWEHYQAVPDGKGKAEKAPEDARERELRERKLARMLAQKYPAEVKHKLQEIEQVGK